MTLAFFTKSPTDMMAVKRFKPTRDIFGVSKHRHWLLVLVTVFFFLLHYHFPRRWLWLVLDQEILMNLECLLLLCSLVPGRVVHWCSIAAALLPFRTEQYACSPVTRRLDRFIVCLVTRGLNVNVGPPTPSSFFQLNR